MKRILLIFMVLSIIFAISASTPNYYSDRKNSTYNIPKQRENYLLQTTFKLDLVNNGNVKFDIVLTNTITDSTYSYTVNESSTSYKDNFKAGTYDIQVTPETMPPTYFATVVPGCEDLIDGYIGSTATIYSYNVMLNSNSDCSSSIITNTQWGGN